MGLFFLWSQKEVISESRCTARSIKNTSHRDTFILNQHILLTSPQEKEPETGINFRSKLRLQHEIIWTLGCYLPQRVSLYINCRKPDTHVKIYYGWMRVREKQKETNVASINNIHYHLIHVLFSWGYFLTQIFTPTKMLYFQWKYSGCIQPRRRSG